MFRRLAPRLCPSVPSTATATATAAAIRSANVPSVTATATGIGETTSTSAASSTPPIPPLRKKPRTFEAVDEAPAATVAPDASSFPPPPSPYADEDPKLSAEAKRKIEIMKEIGDEAFDENTKVLKGIALKGLRSGLIIIVGFVAFMVSLKRKKSRDAALEQQAAEEEAAARSKDPTQRYLEEMSGIGFDVEQGEIDAAEARKKQAAAVANASKTKSS